jgi:hypothetical protein
MMMMKALFALALAALALVQSVAHAQMTPTEQLADQRRRQQQQQQQQQQAQQNARRVTTRRLPAPCAVPDNYYPLRSCRVSASAVECARGWNAWSTFAECCRPGANTAFPQGCTDLNREVECWTPAGFYPTQYCEPTNNLTRCSYNWGQWRSQAECCAPGRAFPQGCSAPKPCWTAATWTPARTCASTGDLEACSRGWGSWGSEAECCAAGNGFSEGCGVEAPGGGKPGGPAPVPADDPFVAAVVQALAEPPAKPLAEGEAA